MRRISGTGSQWLLVTLIHWPQVLISQYDDLRDYCEMMIVFLLHAKYSDVTFYTLLSNLVL